VLSLLLISVLLVAGCGRPSIPGRQFEGEQRTVPGRLTTEAPLPAEPVLEWGPEDAKVQVVAFYPIDEARQRLIDILEELATEEYPGQVHVRYVDYRTPEGWQEFAERELQVAAIFINGESSVELESEKGIRTVDFLRDMGRYWTADDLRQAVDEAVEKSAASP
jgi:hypothetical protein